jgi:hypothetical protein
MESNERRGPQTDKTPAAKSLYRSIVLDNDIWHFATILHLRLHVLFSLVGMGHLT